MAASSFAGNMERFTGFADLYDQYRPGPPEVLAELLSDLAGMKRPALVVDLGCGTGLSTRYWQGKAGEVVGVEPTDAMRWEAERRGGEKIRYEKAFSHATDLAAGRADIVTCSQALHWMEPEPTFREAARLLRKGGVFAAYDYDWPPCTGSWEADAAYDLCMAQGRRLEKERGLETRLRQWEKEGHLSRMRESGVFRYVREICVHHRDEGNSQRLVNLIRSQGYMKTLMKEGLSEGELGIIELEKQARAALGSGSGNWLWTSRVRMGVV